MVIVGGQNSKFGVRGPGTGYWALGTGKVRNLKSNASGRNQEPRTQNLAVLKAAIKKDGP